MGPASPPGGPDLCFPGRGLGRPGHSCLDCLSGLEQDLTDLARSEAAGTQSRTGSWAGEDKGVRVRESGKTSQRKPAESWGIQGSGRNGIPGGAADEAKA